MKFEDDYPEHPKMQAVGPLAIALDVAAIGYAARHLTDGFLPASKVRTLIDLSGIHLGKVADPNDTHPADADDLAEDLCIAGRWHKQGRDECPCAGFNPGVSGYWIHDFQDYNPLRERALAEREGKSYLKVRAGRIGAARRWGPDSRTLFDPQQDGNSDSRTKTGGMYISSGTNTGERLEEGKKRAPSVDELAAVWNEKRGGLLAVRLPVKGKRARLAVVRLREAPDLERWARAIERFAKSDFALGKARGSTGWIGNFGFLVKPETLTRIEEGQFDNRRGPAAPHATPGRYADVTSETIGDPTSFAGEKPEVPKP